MGEGTVNLGVPKSLQAYIGLVGAAGTALLGYLVLLVDWGPATVAELGLFTLLIIVAGSFPLPVAPRVKADVNTAVLFSAVLLLEPGVAALSAVVGVSSYTLLIRFWGDRLRLPWYKYPFNAGQVALLMGLTSATVRVLGAGGDPLSVAVIPAAATFYLVNTALVCGAASLQLGLNPLRLWWIGTKENGAMVLALLSFGFLGALVYQESPWTLVALFTPVAIIYVAFSRLGRTNTRLEETLEKLEALQGRIVSTSKLASVGAISLDLTHQIKNPLAILLGRLEGLQDRLEEGSRERRHLDIAVDAGWRIQELTQTFASIGQQKWVEMDVCKSLDEALGMASLGNRKRIDTDRDYQEGMLRVKGNPVLIREAFSNIFSNAMDAVDSEEALVSVGASRVNGAVVIRITDNGAGIPDESMAHLFEPFHTTKANGNGVGLFAAKHILEMHQGSLEVVRGGGKGTCVTMTLPAVNSPGESSEGSNDIPPSAQ